MDIWSLCLSTILYILSGEVSCVHLSICLLGIERRETGSNGHLVSLAFSIFCLVRYLVSICLLGIERRETGSNGHLVALSLYHFLYSVW